MKKINLCILALIVLSGCSAMRKRCEETSWYHVGEEAGRVGNTQVSGESVRFIRACAEEERPANLSEVEKGIRAGLSYYCQAQTAAQYGRSGLRYSVTVCSTQLQKIAQKAYDDGLVQFCSSEGYTSGLNGNAVEVTCPKELAEKFESQYQKGKLERLSLDVQSLNSQVYGLKEKVKDLEYENGQLKKANSDLESKNRDLESKINRLNP